MKKTFIFFIATLMTAAAFASTAVINFAGQSTEGTTCVLDKVMVENLTQGWDETITDVSMSIEIVNNSEAIDNVYADREFIVNNDAFEGKTQVLFNMQKSGPVSVCVYDVTGRCICRSVTDQIAGEHVLNLEFSTPQMYFLNVSVPGKQFSHSILNLHAGSNTQIQYVADVNVNRAPALFPSSHTCKPGDVMRYTGYTSYDNTTYTDVQTETIWEGNSNILFVFDLPTNVADYYIKHPWGTGADADWSWQPLTKEATNRYTYTGLWGGVGANINSIDSDTGAKWFPTSSITGAAGLQIGDEVTFVYDDSKESLSIETSAGVKTISVSEAVTLTKNGDKGTYNIEGYVTKTYYAYDSQYDNQSFWMADSPGGYGTFVAWRVKHQTLKSTVTVGSKVRIENAQLIYYNNKTPETVAGAYFIVLEEFSGYYIKHPWGTGADADWSWQLMTKESDSEYTYTGLWGGVGANINTSPSDDGASWFPASSIGNSSDAQIGEEVTFVFVKETGVAGTSLTLRKEETPDPYQNLPAAPTGLRVTDENDYRVEIAWNEVEGAYYYNVYRATSLNGTYESYATYRQSLSFMDTGVQTGKTYYYKVSAINGVGEGPQSSAVSGTAKTSGGGGSTTLSAPTGVTATAGSSTITIKWNAVSGADKYNVYRSTSSGGTYNSIGSEYGTSHIDMSVSSGTTYYYKVAAVASDGTVGNKSAAVSATVGGGGGTTTVAAPTNVNAVYMQGVHKVQVTWNEVALCDSYEIYRSTSASSNGSRIQTVSSSSGAVYVDELSSSVDQTWYYYRVKAKSSYLNKTSDYSEQASVYIDKNPVAPCPASNLRISGSSSLTISWSVQTQSGCGTPTEKYIQFYDYSSSASNKWVSEKVSSNSYSLTSTKLNQYTNGGSTLVGCVTFYNASGKSCLHFEYNVNTKKVTVLSTNCYE